MRIGELVQKKKGQRAYTVDKIFPSGMVRCKYVSREDLQIKTKRYLSSKI